MRFHAYKSVAPLKRQCLGDLRGVHLQFPRLQKRGPIEAPQRSAAAPSQARFHAYKSVAPLKRHYPRRSPYSSQAVSTLTKAWPH